VKVEWCERYADKFKVPVVRDLKYALRIALEHIIGSGALREGSDAGTPLQVWRANDKKQYPKPDLTADCVLFRGDDVLLIRRKKEPFQGQWAIPGGYINKGEDPLMAAIRELQEETSIKADKLKLVGVYGKEGRDPRGWVVSTAFAGLLPEGQQARAADDAAEVAWVPIAEALRKPLAFDHSDILKDALYCMGR
jgi:8-oxo-dGTP diphosphatase